VGSQPALAPGEQLVELVLPDPIVLGVVEHRQQHVQMRKQILKPTGRAQLDSKIRALTPGRELGIEGQPLGRDRVAERLEQPTKQGLAAPTRQHRKLGLERDRSVGEFGSISARALERRAEHPRERDAEKRGRDVGTIVDVLPQRPGVARRPPRAADEADGIEVEEQRRGAAILPGDRVKHVRATERQPVGLAAVGAGRCVVVIVSNIAHS
jgi:hypothetical protein